MAGARALGLSDSAVCAAAGDGAPRAAHGAAAAATPATASPRKAAAAAATTQRPPRWHGGPRRQTESTVDVHRRAAESSRSASSATGRGREGRSVGGYSGPLPLERIGAACPSLENSCIFSYSSRIRNLKMFWCLSDSFRKLLSFLEPLELSELLELLELLRLC